MFGATSLAILAAAGLALTAAPAETGKVKKTARDPNEKVCETVPQLGSRLVKKRVCATRAEWEDYRRQDRDAIDQAQRVGCVPGINC